MADDSKTVEAWIEYHRTPKGDPAHHWACDELDTLVRMHPPEAWELILSLVAHAPDDRILANIAGGPLEDLIRRYAKFSIDLVEVQARRDAKFRRCLTGVWLGTDVPESIVSSIRKYTSTVEDPL
jgi:uncharacterized protein DUF6869